MKIDIKSVYINPKDYWKNTNPVMPKGIIACEEETNKWKLFDGVRSFNELPYVSDETGELEEFETITAAKLKEVVAKHDKDIKKLDATTKENAANIETVDMNLATFETTTNEALALKADKTALESAKSELEGVIATKADQATTYTKEEADAKFLTEHQSLVDYAKHSDLTVYAYVTEVSSALSRLNTLENRVSALGKTNITEYTTETLPSGAISDASADVVLTNTDLTNSLTVLSAKSVTLDGGEVSNDARLKLTASNDVEMNGTSFSGTFKKSSGNAVVSVNGADYVSVKGVTFTEESTGYNGLEIGLISTSLPKSILIDSCNFDGSFSNNAISIFGTQDNAVININNCHFNKVSNVLRISNRANAKNVVVNITNCSCDSWEKGEYAGMIVCEDYSSGSTEAETANNLFAPEKIIVNISNFVYNGVKMVSPEALSTVCGVKNDSQILYVYRDKQAKVIPYSESEYPTLTII